MARTTPAQNPRGFNNNKVFVLSQTSLYPPPTRVHFFISSSEKML